MGAMARQLSRSLALRSLFLRKMDSVSLSLPSYGILKALVLLLALANVKNLLFVWHVSTRKAGHEVRIQSV
jgi:hypothetical protein